MVFCLHKPFLNHATIKSGPFGAAKPFDPLWVTHARCEGSTRNARRRDLEGDFSNMEIIANIEPCAFQLADGQIFTKCSGRKILSQLFRPPFIICPTIDVHCLIGSAVMSFANDDIALEPQRCYSDRRLYRQFEYTGLINAIFSIKRFTL